MRRSVATRSFSRPLAPHSRRLRLEWLEDRRLLSLFSSRNLVDGSFDTARDVFSADMDGDGDLDVLGAGEYSDGQIAWWENDGSAGGWGKHVVTSSFGYHAFAVHAADLDGDGDMDVLGGMTGGGFSSRLRCWINDGSGGGWAEHDVAGASWGDATSIYAADFDGDNDIDVVAALGGVGWYENIDGSGTSWDVHHVGSGQDVFAADMDDDGDIDILGAHDTDDDLVWWQNDGVGGGWTIRYISTNFDGASCIAAADLDGDGDEDVLGTAIDAHDLAWWENVNGIGTSWTKYPVDEDFDGARSVCAADIDHDGHLDIVAAAFTADEIAWWENGSHAISWTRQSIDDLVLGAWSVHAADLDGDGVTDVLGTASDIDDIAWWENLLVPDTTPPTVLERDPPAGSTIDTSSILLNITFSEGVEEVDVSDLVLSGPASPQATLGLVTDLGDNTWQFPIFGLTDGALDVGLAPDAGDIKDSGGNDLAYVSWSYTVDGAQLCDAPRVLKEINETGDSNPAEFCALGDIVFFVADDALHGGELWKTDGTQSGTTMVKDIRPGSESSDIAEMTISDGTLYFRANDGSHGPALWRSDGTQGGTVMVKDIDWAAWRNALSDLTDVEGTLFFAATDGVTGSEIWKSDGTEAGTVRVSNIIPGDESTFIEDLTNVNGTLFFTCNDGVHGFELWKSDGTESGTTMVKDIRPGDDNSSWPKGLTKVNETLFFVADTSTYGDALWKSDGSEEGTVMVKDIRPGTSGGNIGYLTEFNGMLFFQADTAEGWSGGFWRSDGTEAGTVEVVSVGSLFPEHMTAIDDALFFEGFDNELWRSDGTEAGTIKVREIAGATDLAGLTNVSGTLYFSTNEPSSGWELWRSDGTAAGTGIFAEIGAGTTGSDPTHIENVNGTLYFSADNGVCGREPWVLDTAPVVLSVTRADPDPTNASSVDFTATFSEDVSGVSTDDFVLTATGGISDAMVTAVSPSGGPATTYRVSVSTGSGEGMVRLDVADDDTIADGGGNVLAGVGLGNGDFISSEHYTIDYTPPSVTEIVRADPDPTNATFVDFTVTFSEDVSGVGIEDFDLTTTGGISDAAVTNVSPPEGPASVYTVTVDTGSGDGTIRLDATDDDTVVDPAGNPLGGANPGNGARPGDEFYTIDKTFPSVVAIIRNDPDPTAAASVDFAVTFDEAVAGVDELDFELTVSGDIVDPEIDSISGGPQSYIVTVNTGSGTGEGTIRLNLLDDDTIHDTASNPLGGPGQGNGDHSGDEYYTISRPPTVTSILPTDPDPTNAESVEFTVGFSEDVSGVGIEDFDLTTTGGISDAAVTNVSPPEGPASVYTVTVDTGSGDGTIRLDATDDDTVVDPAGNPLGGANPGNGARSGDEFYTIDKTFPSVVAIIRNDPDPTAAASVDFAVTFDEAVAGVDGLDFELTVSGDIVNPEIDSISGGPQSYIVTVNTGSGTGEGTIRLDLLDDDTIHDTANNPLGGPGQGNGDHSGDEYYTISRPPLAVSVVRDDPDPTAADLVHFTVTFSEDVDGVDTDDFATTTTGLISDELVLSVLPSSGPCATYTVTVDTGIGEGTIRLDVVDDDTITDSAANPLGGTGSGNGVFTGGEAYTVDIGTVDYPLPLEAEEPLGSLIYDPSVTAMIATVGDTDNFTIDLEEDQTIAIVVDPDTTLIPTIELFGPSSSSIGAANLTPPIGVPGEDAVLQTIETTAAGTYTITVGGASSTTGTYAARVILNAAVEEEEHGGASNDDSGSAQDLDASFITLGQGLAQRGAVIGTFQAGGVQNVVVDSEDFESGSLDTQWTIYHSSTTYGRIQIAGSQGTGGGSLALLMDVNTNNHYTLNEAIWTVDLSGLDEAGLSFYYMDRESSTEDHTLPSDFTNHYSGDGVAISDDGVNWHTVLNAPDQADGTWNEATIDLDDAVTAAGMTLGADFQIKFQQYDNYSFTSDGRGYDEIAITAPAAAEDWYRFSLGDGQMATLGVSATLPDALTMELYDAGSTLLATGTTAGNLDQVIRNFADTTSDGLPDTYYVRITNGSVSEYSLVVTRDMDFDTEVNDSLATAQDITGIGSALGYLDSGQTDYYAITLNANDHVLVTTKTPFSDPTNQPVNELNPQLVVYDPSGTQISSDDNSAPDGVNAKLAFAAATSGSYKIQVLPEAARGEYLLNTNLDNLAPAVSGVTVSDVLISDADTGFGKTFVVTVDFSEPMTVDGAEDPKITFDPAVSSTLTFDVEASDWTDADTYEAVYALSDANVDVRAVTIDVTEAKDAAGNEQQDYTPVAEFDIDTENPSVGVNVLTTGDSTPPLSGTIDDPEACVEVTVDGRTYPASNNGNGTWMLPDDTISPALASGTYDVEVIATDQAGNVAADGTTDELTLTIHSDDIVGRASSSGDWFVAKSDGTSFANEHWGKWSTAVTWSNVLVGDFTGDGKDDVVGRADSTGDWFVAKATDSGFVTEHWGKWTTAVTWDNIMVGDFNGDGKDDLVGRAASSGDWFVGRSTGTGFAMEHWGKWTTAVNWNHIQVGDFNGDGYDDLVGRAPSSGDWFVAKSSSTNFATEHWGKWTTAVTWSSVLVGDFTGDGKDDVVGRADSSGDWFTSRSTGSSFAFEHWGKWTTAVNWDNIMVGDFNGDGYDDLIGRAPSSGDWFVARSSSTSFVMEHWGKWTTAVNWSPILTGDFTGDGKDDLAARADSSGDWFVSRSTGTSLVFEHWGRWTTAVPWVDVQVGDFDGAGGSSSGSVAGPAHAAAALDQFWSDFGDDDEEEEPLVVDAVDLWLME